MASVSPGILVALTWETGVEGDRLSPRPPCLILHHAKLWGEPVTHYGTSPADGSKVFAGRGTFLVCTKVPYRLAIGLTYVYG